MSRILSLFRATAWGTLLLLLPLAPLIAKDASGDDSWQFNGGLSAALATETIGGVNYQSLGLLPDIGWGPLGVGIDLTFHFQLSRHPGDDFGIYPRSEDWWDSKLTTAQNIDKYLSRIVYFRWGHKGDPLYVQAGLLPSTTLGSGFIVGGYNNGALRPSLKYTGLALDASGELIGLPYGGFESFIGNISAFDVLGARVYMKPFGLLAPGDAFLKEIQFGLTVAADSNPYAQTPSSVGGKSGGVIMTGLDTMVPLVSNDLFSAVATADAAVQGTHAGGSIGVGGKALMFFTWGLQNRFLGDNFLPNYFDKGYEVNRVSKYRIYNSSQTIIPGTIGWQASLGTSLLGDMLTFGAVLSGPWSAQTQKLAQPQLQAYAQLKDGLLPISAQAFYVKNDLTSLGKLVSPEDALIGAKVGYTIGVVTLNVVYDLRYLGEGEKSTNGSQWVSTSRVETSVKMF